MKKEKVDYIYTEIAKYLDEANKYGLGPEVVVTALETVINHPEIYKNDLVAAMQAACREWDI